MKALYLAFMLLLCVACTQAQQYIIRYDLAAENVKYYKVKKTGDTSAASVINLSKSNRVNLQLVNAANSYQRQVKYIIKEEEPETVIIPGIGSNPLKSSTGGLPGLDTKSLNALDIFKRSETKGVEIMFDNAEQKEAKLSFTKKYNEFTVAYGKWQKAMLFEQECEVLWKDLAELRYTMQVPENEVKQAARNKTGAIFPGIEDNPSAIKLNTQVVNPQVIASELKNIYNELVKNYSSFRELEIKSPQADTLVVKAEKGMSQVNNTPINAGGNNTGGVVARITDLYRQILNDSYTNLTPLDVNRKTIIAEVRFTPVIDSVTAALLNMKGQDTIKKWITIYKKEPLRFRNTFGFSFVSFAENRWHYFVNANNIIARETADQFQPVVVSYLHFYAPRDKGFRWGGSLGAGLPVGGDNTKLNIMLGLSTFLGKNDPVCISAGVSGTQVKKLSGYSLGDKVTFSALTDNNFASVYRVGYFLALSFNPGSLNSKD
ncbi:MAG: hypothetical protein WBC06_04865 [Chitinophagaceae bacterium]